MSPPYRLPLLIATVAAVAVVVKASSDASEAACAASNGEEANALLQSAISVDSKVKLQPPEATKAPKAAKSTKATDPPRPIDAVQHTKHADAGTANHTNRPGDGRVWAEGWSPLDKDGVWAWGWNPLQAWKENTNVNMLASLKLYTAYYIGQWLVWVVLTILVLRCYPFMPEVLCNPESPRDTFTDGHFSCCKRPSICLCAFCCPAIQWAQTMHLAGFTTLWAGVAIFFACALLNILTFGGVTCVGICTSVLIVLFRQRLRTKLGLQSWTCGNCVFDCLYVCFCPWCAISQEAQVVRYAYQKNGTLKAEIPADHSEDHYHHHPKDHDQIHSSPIIIVNPGPAAPQYGAYMAPQSYTSQTILSAPHSYAGQTIISSPQISTSGAVLTQAPVVTRIF